MRLIMRPSIATVMLNIAASLAQRATCSKLAVGCVLTDKHDRIIGSGYNGVPRGVPHCIDAPCAGACAPKGSDLCQAVHAEQNALLTCKDPEQIMYCYTTHAPCLRCAKMLLNTSCTGIFYAAETYEVAAKELWVSTRRTWAHVGPETGRVRPTV
jgi:dCMP deaminase